MMMMKAYWIKFGLSFGGSLLAGIVLLTSAPAWWGWWWGWVLSPSKPEIVIRYEPPSHLNDADAEKMRATCELEALREIGPDRSLLDLQAMDARRRYYRLCLLKAGFTRTEVEIPTEPAN